MAEQLGYITIGYRDSTGVKSNSTIFVTYDDTATLSGLQTLVNAIAAAEIALSECAVTSVKFTVITANPGPLTPTADSDANEGLLTQFSVTGSKYHQGITIPGMIDGLLVNGKINMSNTTLLAFVNALVGPAAVTGSDDKGNPLTDIYSAAEAFRKLGRQSVKKTRSFKS